MISLLIDFAWNFRTSESCFSGQQPQCHLIIIMFHCFRFSDTRYRVWIIFPHILFISKRNFYEIRYISVKKNAKDAKRNLITVLDLTPFFHNSRYFAIVYAKHVNTVALAPASDNHSRANGSKMMAHKSCDHQCVVHLYMLFTPN